jgi:hypothetical protein
MDVSNGYPVPYLISRVPDPDPDPGVKNSLKYGKKYLLNIRKNFF